MASKSPEHEVEHGIVLENQEATEKPRRFAVVFHNDDFTTQEFVVSVLMKLFHKTESEAVHIMLEVHHRGYGVAGKYSRDVAESKVDRVTAYARSQGHPLKVTAEPDEED